MADLETKALPQILADQATAAQASAGRSLDFTPGGILRAIAEAVGSLALWLQAQILKVLLMTRLSTSHGADADSFVQDYGLVRRPATAAIGEVTLSRFDASIPAFVPVGSLVRTGDGSQTFQVVADLGNPAYSPSPDGYTIAALVASLNVAVEAISLGAGGNVDAATITLLASAIPGVDTVNNAAPLVGGVAAESDDELRTRFPLYLQSLTDATQGAIEYAISQVLAGIRYKLTQNEDAAGLYRGAHFLVVIDDGTGAASPSLINLVGAAIQQTVALGVTFEVLAVVPVDADVSMTLTTAPGADHATAIGLAVAALDAFIAGLDIAERLPFTRLAQVAYSASSTITNVSGVTLNGGTADLVPTNRQRLVADLIAVA